MLTNTLTGNLVAALAGLAGLVGLSLLLLMTSLFLYPSEPTPVNYDWERGPADEQTTVLSVALTNEQVRGETLFTNNCAQCHAMTDEIVVGPGLQGVTERTPSRAWLYSWIRNSPALIATGDTYATAVFSTFNKVQMSSFLNLTDADIDAILRYVETAPVTSPTMLR